MAQPVSAPASHVAELQILREEVEAQVAITAKTKRAIKVAESEIDRLRSDLRQSSDKDANIQEKRL